MTVTTANLRFVNSTMLPNGAYFWRVRSLDAASESSKWSKVRKFTKKWNATAVILTPAALTAIAYPNPTILSWAPVPGAVTYKVAVASGASGGGVDAPGGIISNGALAWSDGGKPIETSNTNLAVSTALHPGTYYWQVIPVDAQGSAGTPSAIFSFAWIWAGTTTPTVTDMVPGIEIYDPLFSWPAIPGAASYEIEVNLTSGFALGSRLMLVHDERDVLRAREVAARTTPTTGASAVSIRRARPGRGTTAPRSTRPTTRRCCPAREPAVYDTKGTGR